MSTFDVACEIFFSATGVAIVGGAVWIAWLSSVVIERRERERSARDGRKGDARKP